LEGAVYLAQLDHGDLADPQRRPRQVEACASEAHGFRFSGLANDPLIQTKTDELRKYASQHKLKTVGEPVLAFYNPPWTLPFFRRNEVMLELAEPSTSD
jgi:hypothetical protein